MSPLFRLLQHVNSADPTFLPLISTVLGIAQPRRRLETTSSGLPTLYCRLVRQPIGSKVNSSLPPACWRSTLISSTCVSLPAGQHNGTFADLL